MENKPFCTIKELNIVKGSTLDPKQAEEIKQRFYVDTCKAVVKGMFQNMNRTDAFVQSTFYLSDLMDAGTLSNDEVCEIECYIHALSLFNKEQERGAKPCRII